MESGRARAGRPRHEDARRSGSPRRTPREGRIFDGYPRTVAQAESLETLLKDAGGKVDVVLFIDVPDATLVDRLLKRAVLEGRADDTKETIAESASASTARRPRLSPTCTEGRRSSSRSTETGPSTTVAADVPRGRRKRPAGAS